AHRTGAGRQDRADQDRAAEGQHGDQRRALGGSVGGWRTHRRDADRQPVALDRPARRRVPPSGLRRTASDRDGHAQLAGAPERRSEEEVMIARLLRALAGCFVAMLVLTTTVATQETLTTARDLYSSAAYEDALAVLNRLRSSDHTADDGRSIEQYRAFCLLALGRADEAERAIEAVVAAQPLYQPSASDVSPRLRTAFSEVRRRMLPGIVQEKYAQAKTAFDRKDFAT